MKHILLVLFIIATVDLFGQGSVVLADKPFLAQRRPDTSVSNALQKQSAFKSLHKSGQELIYWVNVMRKNPKAFGDRYVIPFLEQFPETSSRESKVLLSQMSAINTLPQLNLSSLLVNAAQEHAYYLAEKKAISHTGRGGKGFERRMKEAGLSGCAGENIFDGQDDALMVLILLLIDRGVPGAGHRTALLNPDFRSTGVGIAAMDERRVVFVQQFGCE